jgi:glycosyltransferase involved in cell wall biosynthesis
VDAQQQAVARASDAMIVVSEAMREVAQEQWAAPSDRAVVVPCCTAIDRTPLEQREATRRRLGFQERFVVVYCGGLAPYQMIEQSLDLFDMIRGVRDNALFFGITPSSDRLRQLLWDRGIPQEKVSVVSASHTEVPGLLAAGDLALLLREKSRVNSVASPVKFAEYLAAGLPVVLTQGIGDYSALVCSNGVGCVLPDAHLSQESRNVVAAFLDTYPVNAAELRDRCHALAARELSAERACDSIDAIYRVLSSELLDHRAGRTTGVASSVSSETAA